MAPDYYREEIAVDEKFEEGQILPAHIGTSPSKS